jgi:hypothetical protein
MQYGCGLCNNNHRIILCMINDNYFRAKYFRETAVRGTCNSSKVIFEQLTFEQLISSNCIRAIYLDSKETHIQLPACLNYPFIPNFAKVLELLLFNFFRFNVHPMISCC